MRRVSAVADYKDPAQDGDYNTERYWSWISGLAQMIVWNGFHLPRGNSL